MTSHLEQRRRRAAEAWALADEIVLIGAGEPLSVPGGADQTYPFISHSDYFYLTDRETIGGVLAFDPKDGDWVDFVPDVTEAERVWEGRTDSPGTSLGALAGWMGARRGRAVAMLGVPLAGIRFDPVRSEELREVLLHVRRPKDAVEIERMKKAVAASTAGYAAIEGMIRAGVSEREIQVELESAFARHGGDRTAYGTIVAAGSNAAVLHFTPTTRKLREGEVLLIDAGAEVNRYASDVTRTWRTESGAGTPVTDEGFYRELYQVVLGILERGVERCTAGAEWRELHLAACHEVAEGLAALGVLRGDAATLVERDTHALFFPHGLGHMVGLGVRDAGGYLKGRVKSARPGLRNLRTDLPLQPGYAMTVEPGIYFIRALLEDPARREQYRDVVNWPMVDGLMEFGGIRLEDNVLVTDRGPENLTAAIPRNLAPVR